VKLIRFFRFGIRFLVLVVVKVKFDKQCQKGEIDKVTPVKSRSVTGTTISRSFQEKPSEAHACAGDELDDLGFGNVFFKPHFNVQTRGQVVRVHHGMDQRVDQHAPPSTFEEVECKPSPTCEWHCCMMPRVQKDGILLSQCHYKSINEFVEL